MSRKFSADFAVVKEFIDDYSIGDRLKDGENFDMLFKRWHKIFFAYLTLVSEVSHINSKKPGRKPRWLKNTLEYSRESASDLSTSIFCLLHGAEKPARLMMRSAIETLIKGISSSEKESILEEKNVFGIMGFAKTTRFFSQPVCKNWFDQLNAFYAQLCEDIHTSTRKNMVLADSFKSFGERSLNDLQATSEMGEKITKLLCNVCCVFFESEYHKMHFSNRDVVTRCLFPDAKRYLRKLD